MSAGSTARDRLAVHHGAMRLTVGLLALVLACTPGPQAPSAGGSGPRTPGPVATPEAPPGGLAAAEPQLPSLAEFRRVAAQACIGATATIGGVPLRGDPLHASADRADRTAAMRHYRAAAAAWTAAASELWDFGLPEQAVGQRLITALDTLAQYSHQTAELLQAGDDAGAQAALDAVDDASRQADRFALRLGIGRLAECGIRRARLDGARRVPVDAADFTFGVNGVRAGPTRFVVRNRGDEPHHLVVVRLAEPGTLDEAVRADREGENPRPYLGRGRAISEEIGPGARTTLDVRLPPGPYGLLCFVASPDGTPHAYKGMAVEIVADSNRR